MKKSKVAMRGRRFDDPALVKPVIAEWNRHHSINKTARKARISRGRVRQILLNSKLVKPTIPERRCPSCFLDFFPVDKTRIFCSASCGGRAPRAKRRSKQCFKLKGATTELHLPSGHIAFIDTDDLDRVKDYIWRVKLPEGRSWSFYVKARITRTNMISLHQLILGFPGCDIDHWDGNGLNNRKLNLRTASQANNSANARKMKVGASSIYKGVSRNQNRWMALITNRRRTIFLGRFDDEEDAVRAYDAAAVLHFGPFARPNFASEK